MRAGAPMTTGWSGWESRPALSIRGWGKRVAGPIWREPPALPRRNPTEGPGSERVEHRPATATWLGPIASWHALAMKAADRAAFSGAVPPSKTGVRAAPAQSPPRRADFQEIVLPHLDAAYNLARFLTRDPDAADDIVQDAFLRAFRAFDGFRGGDPRAWLFSIVRNCVRSWAVERNRARVLCEPLDAAAQPIETLDAEIQEREVFHPDQDTPESALLRDSEASLIRRLIEALPHAFREVLILREFEDLSYKQIADITATPIGTVMSRLARARQMLGEAWRGRSGEDRP